MINLEFKTSTKDNNVKLSAIFKADNFVYTTFDSDQNLTSYCSGNPYQSFNDLVKEINPTEVKVAIKTTHFGHFGDKDRIPFDQKSLYIDKMTGQDVFCAYESPFTDSNYRIRHFSTLLNHFYYLDQNDVFHIHFDQNLMHFYVQNEGKMVLYNSYPFENPDDLLYYHTFIAQSLNIDTQQTVLTLSGMIEHNSNAFFKIAPFHNKIDFLTQRDMDIDTERSDLRNHHFFDHYLNIICG